jgi:hypothetical protein
MDDIYKCCVSIDKKRMTSTVDGNSVDIEYIKGFADIFKFNPTEENYRIYLRELKRGSPGDKDIFYETGCPVNNFRDLLSLANDAHFNLITGTILTFSECSIYPKLINEVKYDCEKFIIEYQSRKMLNFYCTLLCSNDAEPSNVGFFEHTQDLYDFNSFEYIYVALKSYKSGAVVKHETILNVINSQSFSGVLINEFIDIALERHDIGITEIKESAFIDIFMQCYINQSRELNMNRWVEY